jgi:hypothetical protein
MSASADVECYAKCNHGPKSATEQVGGWPEPEP